MKSKYFARRLFQVFLSYLVPVLFVCIVFSFLLYYKTREEMVNKVPINLDNLKTSIEASLETTSHISVMLDNHPNIRLSVYKMLNSNKITFADLSGFQLLCSIVDIPVDANVFIDSIYVYLDNNNKNFIASGLNIQNLDSYPDTKWYDSYLNLDFKKKPDIHLEKRTIKNFQFEQNFASVISYYKPIYDGVVVTNIRTDYFNNLLRQYQTFDSEIIFVANVSNNEPCIFFENKYIEPKLIGQIFSDGHTPLNRINYNGIYYIIHSNLSDKHNLLFISLVPESQILFLMAKQILQVVFYVVLVSFILALVTAYSQVRRNFIQLQNIIDLFSNAEKGIINDNYSFNESDEYSLILNNIVQLFITQSYLRMQLSERIYRQKIAELTALQLQINPHFLFNTLQTISFEIGKYFDDETPVQTSIKELSVLLRYSLQNFSTPVSLSDEIYYTKIYCNLQKFRYEDKFEVFWEYDIKFLDTPFLRMIFQPLIENSIQHGIGPKKGTGFIKVKITEKNNNLLIRIIDNGVGIDREDLTRISSRLEDEYSPLNDEYIGLSNTNQRLVLKYGHNSKLNIKSKKRLGTIIWFLIPFK